MTAARGDSRSATILIVDDDPAKRLSLRAVLEPLGHTLIEVDSGEAALHAVMEWTFALILLDVEMPAMDGYETAKLIRMRRECESTPIMFVTAHAEDEAELSAAYATGAVDFMFAPLVAEVLRAKVSVFVDLFLKSRELERSLAAVTVLSHRFRDNEARTLSVLDHVADGIVTVTDDGLIESFNRAASDTFGYTEAEAIGQPFSMMVPDVGETASDMASSSSPRPADGSVGSRGRRRDGTTFPLELNLSELELGDRTIHIGCLRDVSQRQSYTDTLQHQAMHDELTGLPNRILFEDRITQAISSAQRESRSLALLLVDLNGFKRINDTFGHQSGDVLLQLVSARLISCLREGDTVARLGGDEFGILPSGDTDVAGAVSVAWKIQQAFARDFLVDGHMLGIGLSIGIALYPEHGGTIDDLHRRADRAMFEAKRSGIGYSVFVAEQEEDDARRLALLTDLRHCIGRDELILHFQPKIDLASRETIGFEALIRWNHPVRGMVSPDEFMPEVETNELMISITDWVINEALRHLKGWRDAGFDLTVAVNLGARCLGQGNTLFEKVAELTRAWDVPPEKLTFELTESALIDTTVPMLLEQLAAMPERLSIDDFGTGYSSLVYLQRLPVVEIKADRSFVTSMSTTRDDAIIVQAIVDLAHNLGVTVVAEGVEDEATMKLLTTWGCDAAQGYYFSRPMDADDVGTWLDASEYGTPRRLQAVLAAAPEPVLPD